MLANFDSEDGKSLIWEERIWNPYGMNEIENGVGVSPTSSPAPGRNVAFDQETETIPSDPGANIHVKRSYRTHWGTPKLV